VPNVGVVGGIAARSKYVLNEFAEGLPVFFSDAAGGALNYLLLLQR